MFAFVVLDLVFEYLAERLAGKNVLDGLFRVGWDVKP